MNEDRITEVFDKIYETGALIIKPAKADELTRCQQDLADIHVPQLPADYIEFLQIANGLAWNGFEFYGTYQVTEKKSGYCLKDIVSANIKWHDRKIGLAGKLLLGTFDDDIYVYAPESAEYQTLDSLTLSEIDTCESFEELFIANVAAYVDDDEDWPFDDEDASREDD